MADQDTANLDTRLDPAFGLLGACLIISGLALACAGSAYKRLATFVVTFYSLAITTLVLILHFGVEKQIKDPTLGVRIGFLFGSLVSGAIFGVASVIFYRSVKLAIPAVAGFLFGLTLQSLKSDGLIRPLGLRYLLFLGLTAATFIAGIVPRLQSGFLLVSTSFIGALAAVIGIDCFTTANLKEFLVYNLGFSGLFSKLGGHFRVTSTMQIELGVLLLLFVVGVAVQIRFFGVIDNKLSKILRKQTSQDEEAQKEDQAAQRLSREVPHATEKFEQRYSKTGFPFRVPPQHALDTTPSPGSGGESPVPPYSSQQATPVIKDSPILPQLQIPQSVVRGRSAEGVFESEAVARGAERHQASRVLLAKLDETPIRPISSSSPSSSERAKHGDRDINGKRSNQQLAQEIEQQQNTLDEIGRLRASLTLIRQSLDLGAKDEETRGIDESAAAGRLPSTVHDVSHKANVAGRRPTWATSAPRPLSTHSQIVVQSRPEVQRVSLAQRQSLARPWTSHATTTQARSTDHGSTSKEPQRTSKDSSTLSPVRIITGVQPPRPVLVQSSSHNGYRSSRASLISAPSTGQVQSPDPRRSQTLTVGELDARHRKRLSEMQKFGVAM